MRSQWNLLKNFVSMWHTDIQTHKRIQNDIIYNIKTGNQPNQLSNDGFHAQQGNIAIKMMVQVYTE